MAVNGSAPITERVSGEVTSSNDKGIRLAGHDGWLNFSKFAPAIVPPERGRVRRQPTRRQ